MRTRADSARPRATLAVPEVELGRAPPPSAQLGLAPAAAKSSFQPPAAKMADGLEPARATAATPGR